MIASCLGALALTAFLLLSRGGVSGRQAPAPGSTARSDGAAAAVPPSPQAAGPAETPARASAESGPDAEKEPASPPDALAQAEKELTLHAAAALDGVLYLNDVLDYVLEFASLPVADHPDLDFEDNDAIAYELEGTPEGTEARMLVGMLPYYEDDRTFRYVQMDIDVHAGQSELMQGVMREHPNVNLSISYDVADGRPTRFALQLGRRVDLAASRDAGINAYEGQYTSGSLYWVDLEKDPDNPTTTTFGIVDGQHVEARSFPGIAPLAGDTDLDPERLNALLALLQQHRSTIKGE